MCPKAGHSVSIINESVSGWGEILRIPIVKKNKNETCEVSIIIYDVIGREVKQLINARQEAGYHSMLWNGRNSQGQNVGAGVYFYMIQANDFRQVRKMLLLK